MWLSSVVSNCLGQTHEFSLGGVTMQLSEVTTNLDVYFRAMRWNRVANEWDVDVTISNKSGGTISAPLVMLVDSFTGTTGPLRPDGVSTNQAFYEFSGQMTDGVLLAGSKSASRTLGIAFTTGQSPKLVTRLFSGTLTNPQQALGFVRSLNQAGQPLAAVTVEETGPSGNSVKQTDSLLGTSTLGKTPGDYLWKLSKDGYMPVWRQVTLQSNTVAIVPYPWLSARSLQTSSVSPLLGGTVSNQTVVVRFPPGSAPQATTGQVTELSGQTLPLFLPAGWSPLQAFWLELGVDTAQPLSATIIPWGPISSSENAALVKFNSTALNWQVVQMLPGNDTNQLSVSLPGIGIYALVVPDTAPAAPPSPVLGAALQPAHGLAVDPANLQARGTVTPATSPASVVPELVTADADLTVSNRIGGLSSGTLLRGEVNEQYFLRDGTSRTPPVFQDSIVAYQRPGQPQLGILHAHFPLRPLLLMGPDTLDHGVVHVDLFPPGSFTGSVLDTNGGVVANGGVRLLVGPQVLPDRQAVQLQWLNPTNFTDLAGTNYLVIAAFEVAMGTLPPGAELLLQSTGVPPNMTFVLARVVTEKGLYGLEPRKRLLSDGNGNLSSAEPTIGDHLPGLSGSGEYVLLQVQPQQGIVEGIAKNAAGQAAGGLPVRVANQPWLTFSAFDGSFKLLAPSGSANLVVSDLVTGDSGNQTVTVPPNLSPVTTNLSALASGLRVASITPLNNATNVPQVSSVLINFNRAVNPATLVNSFQLLGPSNQVVSTTFSLNLANTTVTLLPNASLDTATLFTVVLSTNITDSIGRPLQGQTQFTFTTVALSARDPAAQLIIYEPGATNLATNVVADLPGYAPGTNKSQVVVHGTSGSADPGVPVVVVNEASGETTTVISKSDGSFTTFVNGVAQDFISATFVGLNGSRLYVPVNRQLFDDGSVGLFPQGGSLQAVGDGGPVKVTIPPNALQGRTKFKLSSINVPELQAQLGGVLPTNATVAGSALNLHIEGPAPVLPVQVSFPVNLTSVGYPTNESPTNVAAMVALVRDTDNVTSFEVMNQMTFTPQVSSPAVKGKNNLRRGPETTAGALETALQLTPLGFQAKFLFDHVIVPLIFGPRPVTVKGQVSYIPSDILATIQAGQRQGQNLGVASLIGFGGQTLGVVGQVFFTVSMVEDFLFTTAELGAAKPLSGAFVVVNQSSVPDFGPPGRVQQGMVYATSSSDGSFLTVAPMAGDQYLISASHPLYEKKLTLALNPVSFNPLLGNQLSLAGVVFKNFFFSRLAASLTPPNVSIAAQPAEPAPGQSCAIQINAFQPSAPPRIGVTLDSVGARNLLTGLPAGNVHPAFAQTSITTNGNTVQWNGTITLDAAVRATLKLVIQGATSIQSIPQTYYNIDFTGPIPPTFVATIPPPDTNDVHGPLVVQTDPVEHGFVGENAQISVRFNKPIDSYVSNHFSGIVLSGPGIPPALSPILRLSGDQQTLTIQYSGLNPGADYSLSLAGPSVRDLSGRPLDQKPSTTPADSFVLNFRTAPIATANLPQLANGRGAVVNGSRLYALDQAPQGNYLLVYDISAPLKPQLLSRNHLFGAPRDLVVIPQYRYYRSIHSPPQTNDLVVVVGGDLDARINDTQGTTVSVPGQYLWVYSVGDGTAPQLIAQPIVSYRVGSAVTKVRWSAPSLIYQESGADIQLLSFVNLQELLIGYGASRGEQSSFPDDGYAGVDTNNDGDYVDPGEKPPLPERSPAEFYGKHQSYVLQHTTQKILDFSVSDGGAIVGVTMRNGIQLKDDNTSAGTNLPPMYRTLAFSGQPLNTPDPTNCAFSFGPAAYPRWVTVFDHFRTQSNGVPVVLSLAMVSLEPDNDNTQKLAVIDITLPGTPRLLSTISVPGSLLGGSMQSISRRADGMLELAGSQNLLVLDPSQILTTNNPDGQLHPAILDLVPGAGGITRSLGSSDFGVHGIADSGRAQVIQSPPELQFVKLPFRLVDPATISLLPNDSVAQLYSDIREAGWLPPANLKTNLNLISDLDPPNPSLHYYVLLTAPGGSGSTLNIGLESLNEAGRPYPNRGPGYGPVRAVSDSTQAAIGQKPRANCGALIRSLTAYRMSNDPHSAFYNRYLSKPFALIVEQISLGELSRLKAQFDREILSSGHQLRAFIDPQENTNAAIGSFAAQIDNVRQVIYPISEAIAFAVNQSYYPGDNPPPPGGAAEMPGTYGTVAAHSGEFRTETTDMALPSPRMPIQITRQIGSQDTYEGPFGVGWDFNYNQRVTVLDPNLFPSGLQMPIIARDTISSSEIAASQDVLFHSGKGQIVIFKWVDTNMPPEYAADPLVQQFGYQQLVSDYYLPSKGQGVFDLFVKFKDGRFERLTPEGLRYRYAPQGRLEFIMDKYPVNRHELQYDDAGHLVRIDDHSVSSPRYVQFGYFRQQSTDNNFNSAIDIDTSNPMLTGKICRLKDYAGGDVLYQYSDDGFLTNRLGKQVAGENGGFAGRGQTFYTYSGCQIVGVGATANGTPIFSAVNGISASGKQVAQSGTGLGNQVTLNIPLQNTAANLASLTSVSGLADGSTAQLHFDSFGHTSSTSISGPGTASATTSNLFDQNGLLLSVRHPEGNSESMTYDTNNAVFRSRRNLLSRTVNPGPRGGAAYTESFNFDPSFNIQTGAQLTADGFTWTYALTADKREVASITYGTAGQETLSYNSHGQQTSRTDIRGVQAGTIYDSATGFPASHNQGTNQYSLSYGADYASQLGLPASLALPTGAPVNMLYNANLQKVDVARGSLIERYTYDEQGRGVLVQQQLGGGQVLTVHRAYDEKGFLKTNILDSVEVDGTPTSIKYDFTPDLLSRIRTIRYPQGTLQTFNYDSRGNVTNMVLGSYAEDYGRDLNDNVVSLKQGGAEVTTTVYDGLDRAKFVTHKTGGQDETETFDYYPRGEIKSRTMADPLFGETFKALNDQIDAKGRIVHRTVLGTTISPSYQYAFAPLSETITGPRMTTVRSWTTAGYQTLYSDPILSQITVPNGIGKILQTDSLEDGATYSLFYGYDAQDNRTSVSDQLGLRFGFAARAEGSLSASTNANAHVMTYGHSVLSELTGQTRADGMEIRSQHDSRRQVSFTGDPAGGMHFSFDQDFRLASTTLRSGAQLVNTSFDGRNLPTVLTMPGGSASMQYDLKQRLIDKTVTFGQTSYSFHYTYDSMDRVRISTYNQNGGSLNTATFTYDKAGPLLSARYQEDGADYLVQYSYYGDGQCSSLTYPSGYVVNEQRDNAGRLTGISDSQGNIVSVSTWQGNSLPKTVTLGANINVSNLYDPRGRLLATRTTGAGGTVIAHLRYQYDPANNLLVRQFLHRQGRSDAFSYDVAERLSAAKVGALPLGGSNYSPGLYERTYKYHLSGLDYLTSATCTNLLLDPPVFATNWTSHDPFLAPTIVDAFPRGPPDSLGNVTNLLLQSRSPSPGAVSANALHDGLGRLVRLTRADAITQTNFFQAEGLRYRRLLTQEGFTVEDRRYAYDIKGRLIEEFDRTYGTNQLVGRFYYTDSDAPDAADLFVPSSGTLSRYYYLKDNMGSVVALADSNGAVVERVWYDPHGGPVIEQRDTKAPTLQSVVADTNGALLVILSESVGGPLADPGPGTAIVPVAIQTPAGVLSLSYNSTNISGTVELLPSLPGYPPYSVLRFTPSQSLPDSPSSLVAWWPGDAAVSDVAGGLNGALRGGASSGPGLVNQGFVLNGSNAWVEIPNNSALNPGVTDFTFALWANLGATNGPQVLAEKWNQTARAGWSFSKLPDNSLQLAVGDGAGNEIDITSSPLRLPRGTWLQYAIRRQGNQFAIFTNGVSVATGSSSFALTATNSLKFGSRDGTSLFFNGTLDELTFFSRALSAAEISAIAGGVAVPGPVTLSLNGGFLADEWGNSNSTATVSFALNNQPGTFYYSATPHPQTAATRTATSLFGSSFLFHGQYFDYPSGLVYLRARFYDPYSGMFLEPDPLGYLDTVNLYAGLKNNPVGTRDPSGLTGDWLEALMRQAEKSSERISVASKGAKEARMARSLQNESLDTAIGNTLRHDPAAAERLAKDLEGVKTKAVLGVDQEWGMGRSATTVRLTAETYQAEHFMDHPPLGNPDNWLDMVERVAQKTRQEVDPSHIIVNLEGFEKGTTVAEKFYSAVYRGRMGYINEIEKKGEDLAFLRTFLGESLHTPGYVHKGTLNTVKVRGNFLGWSSTDIEMYYLYKNADLSRVTFVRGMDGEVVIGNALELLHQ